ncbi:MAG: hypothetical protein JOZ61_02290 [Verrucomicrobia bacterium]|nr:hypothetical protein [Verrucomicrobiota bacterium]
MVNTDHCHCRLVIEELSAGEVRLRMLRRFGNRAEGMFDIEWHVRLEIENDSEPQADLVGVVVR